ncbi:MAG: 2-polyprenylphenol 6-hydroxylase [Sphingomonadales bacterium]|nr:2-polyprenylphenol 6-hydroxylase [Sphingomonadales bacterium]
MANGLSHAWRLLTVVRTLARHNALFPLDALEDPPLAVRLSRRIARLWYQARGGDEARPGARLATALEALGPAFVKLGQALATRPDLVGSEIARDLTALQDKLPPFSAEEARAVIARELGKPVDTLFATFDDTPVAAASIAQVHYATAPDGAPVAVKVLRPGIEKRFSADLESFLWFARIVERAEPKLRRLKPVEVVKTLEASVRLEMDLRMEAAAASELAENMAGEPGYRVPKVDWKRTARRVMTMERIDGTSLADSAVLAGEGHDLRRLAETIVQVFLRQAMRDGFFHADLHQGNLLVEADGTIAAVDFGIMGRLDRDARRFLAEILWGFLEADYGRIADIHFEAGYVPAGQSRALFAQAMRAIAEPIQGLSASEVSLGRLLAQLFATTERFDMATRPELLMLQKTMVMVEGLASGLDENVNMWTASRPAIEDWMRENLGPEARIADAIIDAGRLARALPELIRALEAGDEAPPKPLETGDDRPHLKGRTHRALWLVAGLIAGVLLGTLVTL